MSYAIGRAALNMQWTERVARTEYNDNWEIVRHLTGKDPREDPSAYQAFNDAIHLDYLWAVNDGPVPWSTRGRTTDMGHAVYMEDGSDYRPLGASPFAGSADVLRFNAVEEYGLPDFGELVAYYEGWFQQNQRVADQVVSGGYYKTIVSGAIEAFGWERLLEAVGDDAERFGEAVLGSIFEVSLHHYKAWAETSIEVFMCHDDMVWTSGPFIHPDFYRTYIFPRYQALWAPLKAAGKRIIYCSDGTYDMFVDELAAAGADGFCFEPTNDLEMLVRK
ncbi:MAG TPA: uroporphyrinogen decarboxylase family protein, partial [Armatimonadota bacterium]|nr:uroporphyrinogen decarboxylase family protein [Armatimonadota bacterium]